MEGLGAENLDLNLGRRLFVIVFFLLFLWYVLNYLVTKIKSGQIKIPELLKSKIPALKNLEQDIIAEPYKLEIIQRKILPDGSELQVLDVNGRHVLLSKHMQSGINYITDLNQPKIK